MDHWAQYIVPAVFLSQEEVPYTVFSLICTTSLLLRL